MNDKTIICCHWISSMNLFSINLSFNNVYDLCWLYLLGFKYQIPDDIIGQRNHLGRYVCRIWYMERELATDKRTDWQREKLEKIDRDGLCINKESMKKTTPLLVTKETEAYTATYVFCSVYVSCHSKMVRKMVTRVFTYPYEKFSC